MNPFTLWKYISKNTVIFLLLFLIGGKCFDFHVTIVWLLFMVVIYLEGIFSLRLNHRHAIFWGLINIMYGLSSMLFYSAIFSMVLEVPLSYFNDPFPFMSPLKALPIVLTYISLILIFSRYLKRENEESFRYIIQVFERVKFLTVSLVISVVFLIIQSMLYCNLENTLTAKLWSFGSCIYLSVGFYFVFGYAARIGRIYQMEAENAKMKEVLQDQEIEESFLQEAIEFDELTGVYTRVTGEQKVYRIMEQKNKFYVCLIDLDGLKYVNDHLGHGAGDTYLCCVSKVLQQYFKDDILFRYGGDEFVLVCTNSTEDTILKCLGDAHADLHNQSITFQMSISYGICVWQEGDTYHGVLAEADRRMYLMKCKHKEENPNFERRGL